MIAHDSFSLTCDIRACRAHVFAAWADPALKRRWFVEGDEPGLSEQDYALDFRTGGTETGRFVLAKGPGAGEHRNVTHYLDIEPDARIVFAYTMALNGRSHSASLATVALEDLGRGTRLTYTEQGAFYEHSDGAAGRRHGWSHLLASLETSLHRKA